MTWARWRSRSAKAAHIRRLVDNWGDVRRVLLVGAGQAWTPLDVVVERAAAETAEFVVATDLHSRTQVPWPYLRADGLRLPFQDAAFDLVLSNAVVEHVGGKREQEAFVAEHLRVARRFIITTPNRWFPVETHTRAILRHWSPQWRSRNEDEFTRLLSMTELRELLPPGSVIHGKPWSSTFLACSA